MSPLYRERRACCSIATRFLAQNQKTCSCWMFPLLSYRVKTSRTRVQPHATWRSVSREQSIGMCRWCNRPRQHRRLACVSSWHDTDEGPVIDFATRRRNASLRVCDLWTRHEVRFDLSDLGDSLGVNSPFERGVEPPVQEVECRALVNHLRPDHHDVGVVVAA